MQNLIHVHFITVTRPRSLKVHGRILTLNKACGTIADCTFEELCDRVSLCFLWRFIVLQWNKLELVIIVLVLLLAYRSQWLSGNLCCVWHSFHPEHSFAHFEQEDASQTLYNSHWRTIWAQGKSWNAYGFCWKVLKEPLTVRRNISTGSSRAAGRNSVRWAVCSRTSRRSRPSRHSCFIGWSWHFKGNLPTVSYFKLIENLKNRTCFLFNVAFWNFIINLKEAPEIVNPNIFLLPFKS